MAIISLKKMDNKVVKSYVTIFIVLLFIFSVGLDYEYTIATIKGKGELLSQSSVLIGDKLERLSEVNVPLKSMDILTIAIFILVAINRKKIMYDIKLLANNGNQYIVILFTALLIWPAISILVNIQAYTWAQILIMTLHMLKLIQVILIGLMIAFALRNIDIKLISNPLIFGFSSVFIILILNTMGLISIGKIAGDRMETYGVAIIAVIAISHLYGIENKINMSFLKKYLYISSIILGSTAIFISEKRAVMFTHFFCIIIIIIINLFNQKRNKSFLNYILLIILLVHLPLLITGLQRTIPNTYNAVHGTEHHKAIYAFSEKFSSKTKEYLVQEGVPIISNLDYSGADRVGKYIKTMSLISENIWIGTGFWGTQYKFGFLPDSGLQIILENGMIFVLLLLITVYCILGVAVKKQTEKNNQQTINLILVLFITVALLSIFSNPLYMSRFLMALVFFVSFFLLNKSQELNHF